MVKDSNIQNGINGILLDHVADLKDIILDINGNKEKYLNLGANAFEYYRNNRKPSDMVDGLLNAVNYVLN